MVDQIRVARSFCSGFIFILWLKFHWNKNLISLETRCTPRARSGYRTFGNLAVLVLYRPMVVIPSVEHVQRHNLLNPVVDKLERELNGGGGRIILRSFTWPAFLSVLKMARLRTRLWLGQRFKTTSRCFPPNYVYNFCHPSNLQGCQLWTTWRC